MVSAHRWVMTDIGQPMKKESFEMPAPGAGEVLVEVAGCGVCHTDLGFLYDGVRTKHPLPLTLGHEISGRVIQGGEGAEGWQGKSVIIPAVMPCGECDLCRRGLGNICREQKMPGNDIHGGFATHITVPGRGLCEVDESRLEKAGLQLEDLSVVADAVTTPYQAVTQAGVKPGDLAVVIGVGGVGTYAVQIARAMGAEVVAVDIDQDKLDQVARYGAGLTLNAREVAGKELKKAIKAFATEQGLRQTEWVILECSGTGAGQETAFGLLTFGGTLAVVGFTMEKLNLRLSNLMAFHARAQGNWGCLPEYYPEAVELILDGKVALAPFVERHPLEKINEIFEAAHEHQLKQRAILVPNHQ